MDRLLSFAVAGLITSFFFVRYVASMKRKEKLAAEAAEKGKLFTQTARAQHPQVDVSACIGCGSCTHVCPEGDVLAMLGGKAVIINVHKCVGHSLCAEACPVGAITMRMASPSMSDDLPRLSPECETNIENLFIVGELGGLALIKNAINQGKSCVDTIASRLAASGTRAGSDILDVIIVGAGPAGISASLRAIENKLSYMTLEQDEVGGTVAKYPRQKLVLTSPVELPFYGKFKSREVTKENLLQLWAEILKRADFNVRTGERVESVQKDAANIFTVTTTRGSYRARAVVLALGRAGTPRKLGVKGEELPKVMYRLIEADHYVNKKIMVVGGGDSAVEAAMGLAHQVGNRVTLSYRKEAFSRIKERNALRLEELTRKNKLEVIFNSAPVEIKPDSVVLDCGGQQREIENDFVWVFAGGIAPTEFLTKMGIQVGAQDVTANSTQELRSMAAAQTVGV